MRVERCPSCGARYNVTRLATGTRFSCRRCGAVVTVGAQEGVANGAHARTGLVVLGVLGLATVVLRGLPSTATWMEPDRGNVEAVLGGLALQELVALGVAGLACVLAGLAGVRARPLLLIAAATTAFWVVARALGAATPAFSTRAPDPGVFLGLALLAAAVLLLAGPHRDGRATARAWALVGAGLLLASIAGRPLARPDDAGTVLTSHATDVATFWRDVVWRGDAPPAGASPWSREIPWTAQALAALLALLAAALPLDRLRGLTRFLARTGFLLLVLAALAPPLAIAWAQRDDLLGAEGALRTLRLVTETAWDDAIVPALLTILLLGACAQERATNRASSPTTPRPRSGLRHAALALGAAATALCLENPGCGVLSTRWPWEEALQGFATAASATACLLGALALTSTLAWWVPPLRRGGVFVALGAALAAGASELRTAWLGVPGFTVACIVSAGAGLIWAQRGTPWSTGGRLTSGALGIALLGLLLWPRSSPEILGIAAPPFWPCVATSLGAGMAGIARADGQAWEALLQGPTATAVLACIAVLVFLGACAAGPRRVLAVVAGLLAVIAAIHPVAEAFLFALPAGGFDGTGPLAEAGQAAGRALLLHPAAVVWATFVVSAEAASGPPA